MHVPTALTDKETEEDGGRPVLLAVPPGGHRSTGHTQISNSTCQSLIRQDSKASDLRVDQLGLVAIGATVYTMVLSYLTTILGRLSSHSLDAFEDENVHSARLAHRFLLTTRDDTDRHLADLTLLQERITTCNTSPYSRNSNSQDSMLRTPPAKKKFG